MQSIKHKLNTKSSTEAELVGVDDILTLVIWTRYLLKEQGCKIHNNVVYQDNQSAIKIENNGRQFISNSMRHLNVK